MLGIGPVKVLTLPHGRATEEASSGRWPARQQGLSLNAMTYETLTRLSFLIL